MYFARSLSSSPCVSSRTVLLHDGQELDDDLGAWADEDLAFARLFGVVDGIEGVVENACSDHGEGLEILNSSTGIEVSKSKDSISHRFL